MARLADEGLTPTRVSSMVCSQFALLPPSFPREQSFRVQRGAFVPRQHHRARRQSRPAQGRWRTSSTLQLALPHRADVEQRDPGQTCTGSCRW